MGIGRLMTAGVAVLAPLAVLASLPAFAGKKLTFEERIEITRGLTAEFATAKVLLPRSKKPLSFSTDGSYDKQKWSEIERENGPAARVGDQVQITKVEFESDKLVLEFNGGGRSGPKWYERIEVGMGTRTRPINAPGNLGPGGTSIAVLFPEGVPAWKPAEFKKVLAPILDFEKRSATEQYVESLPAPIQAAIKEQRAVEGMDKDQVLLALGRPRHKIRETKDGMELEEWIYGEPPGRITFVVFNGSKVIQVKEAYAGLGGSTAPPLEPR